MKRNNGFNPKTFTVIKEKHLAAYIPGVGRYCQCGCNRIIAGRIDKRFFSPACRRRNHDKTKGVPLPKYHLESLIFLKIIEEPYPHRKITLYLNKGNKIELKLIPEYKEIWDILNKITEYRQLPYNEKIIPLNLLAQVNKGR